MVLNGPQLEQVETIRRCLDGPSAHPTTITLDVFCNTLLGFVDILTGKAAPALPVAGHLSFEREVVFSYTNWKGESSIRRVVPLYLAFESTEWHPGIQWILHAYDLDKRAERGFAVKDIRDWGCATGGTLSKPTAPIVSIPNVPNVPPITPPN